MRKVFNSMYDVAHLWAHQKQEEASCGHLYFQDETIYSYGSHYEVGKIVYNQKGEKAYVLNTLTYSPSTLRHQGIVRSSVPSNSTTFDVKDCVAPVTVDGKPALYNKAMLFIAKQLDEMYEYIEKQRRARVSDYRWAIVICINQIHKWIDFWQLDKAQNWRVCEYRGINDSKRQPTVYKYWGEANYDKIKEDCSLNDEHTATCIRLFSLLVELKMLDSSLYGDDSVNPLLEKFFSKEETDAINYSIKKAKVRYKRKVKNKRKLEIKQQAEDLELWKKGKKSYVYTPYYFLEAKGWDTALRINDGYIQTSKSIRLSLEEGKRLWIIIKAFEQGKMFQHQLATDTNQHQWEINSYENHVLTAGCHHIPFSECERIAKIMNWQ